MLKLFTRFSLFIIIVAIHACHSSRKSAVVNNEYKYSIQKIKIKIDPPPFTIEVGETIADEWVTYAEQFLGIKYVYGGTEPKTGFDCSGFLHYVSSRFGIKVPRTSEQYTYAGKEVDITEAKRGDLILFTGSDPNSGKVGHIGIIVNNKSGKINFIHAASGGGKGISYSEINSYFAKRFVKINRIFQ